MLLFVSFHLFKNSYSDYIFASSELEDVAAFLSNEITI